MQDSIPPTVSDGQNQEAEGKSYSSLEHVCEAIKQLRFGTVLVTVQDGVIVQIDRTEKWRFQARRHRHDRGHR